MAPQTPGVSPRALRAGETGALRDLLAVRGGAVHAYCSHLVAADRVLGAAAQALARFRADVVAAGEGADVEPESLLLSATREAAAAAALNPAPAAWSPAATWTRPGRGRARTCTLMPELLVACAENRLSAADAARLGHHLARCARCRGAERRFAAAETAYRNPPEQPLPSSSMQALELALREAAPAADTRDQDLPPTEAFTVDFTAPDSDHTPAPGRAAPGDLGALAAPEVEPAARRVPTEEVEPLRAAVVTAALVAVPTAAAEADPWAADPAAHDPHREDRRGMRLPPAPPGHAHTAAPGTARESAPVRAHSPDPSAPPEHTRSHARLIALSALAAVALICAAVLAGPLSSLSSQGGVRVSLPPIAISKSPAPARHRHRAGANGHRAVVPGAHAVRSAGAQPGTVGLPPRRATKRAISPSAPVPEPSPAHARSTAPRYLIAGAGPPRPVPAPPASGVRSAPARGNASPNASAVPAPSAGVPPPGGGAPASGGTPGYQPTGG